MLAASHSAHLARKLKSEVHEPIQSVLQFLGLFCKKTFASRSEAQNPVSFGRYHLRDLVVRVSAVSKLGFLRVRDEKRNLSFVSVYGCCIRRDLG